ncbi:MAG TPA: Eco57I restriction-modification methylase domain-containing protein [Candidatus Bathyarchaeia archaeon]|nr:Eco57I restriction-modification methylase domain-containing protein [Candidatus Bathyarchaeia archaeon]
MERRRSVHLLKDPQVRGGRSSLWKEDLEKRERKSALGQFLTPRPVADLMASFFEQNRKDIELLDAGAGKGSLTEAFVRAQCTRSAKPNRIAVTAYEIDEFLLDALHTTLLGCEQECETAGIKFSFQIRNEDFVLSAAESIRGGLFVPKASQFSAAIANPPYRKIQSDSRARANLRTAGIETSNIYTGFLALIIKLLSMGGELVAISPRSFCNGPYFKPFRSFFLENISLRRLHVFESRSAAFKDDQVLQENLIFHGVRGGTKPKAILISTSSGRAGDPLREHMVASDDVVSPSDTGKFIHLPPANDETRATPALDTLPSSLTDLGLSVSTGRVVDFRAKHFLRENPGETTVPLIYPCHFDNGFVKWPKPDSRKPNAIVDTLKTRELLVPAGIYVLVKRFSAKEEPRRIVASIYDANRFNAPHVGFENHLNYFHIAGTGMPMNVAKGLTAFLNSTAVDQYFRRFSGHTQVNATDLRSFRYPTRGKLEQLGSRLDDLEMPQQDLDDLVRKDLF